jgi:hypothetical protein
MSDILLILICHMREWVHTLGRPGGSRQREPEVTGPHFLTSWKSQGGKVFSLSGISSSLQKRSAWSLGGIQSEGLRGSPTLRQRECHPCLGLPRTDFGSEALWGPLCSG